MLNKKIILALLGLLGTFLIGAIILPDQYRVERSVRIKAPMDKVFSEVSYLENWEKWSPWKRQDPEATYSYSGVLGEEASSMTWDGEVVGRGSLRLKKIEKNQKINTVLNFVEPFESSSNGEWIFKKEGEFVVVTWANYGPLSYPLERYLGFFAFDSMIGEDFQQGLNNLKEVCEQ